MRQAGDDREVVAEVLEHLQVRRERVVLAGLLRERNSADAARAACRCRPCGAAAPLAAAARARGRAAASSQRQRQRRRRRRGGSVRRSSSWSSVGAPRCEASAARLTCSKQLALHDLVDQRPQAVVLVADLARRSPRSRGSVGRRRARRRWRRSAACRSGARASWSLSVSSSCLNSSMFAKRSAVGQHVGRVDLRALVDTASGGRRWSPACRCR